MELIALILLSGFLYFGVEASRFWRWWKDNNRDWGVWGFRRQKVWRSWEVYSGLCIWWNLIFLIVAIGLTALSYLLAPKPKAPKPSSTEDLNDPVAEAGMPVPVVFGTITLKGLNAMMTTDKRKIKYKVSPP